MSLILKIVLLAVAVLLLVMIYRKIFSHRREQQTITRMCDLIFPDGIEQKETILDDIADLTKGRFNREDILDYYLKIKGLQILDMHANGDKEISRYLMRPTKIRLNYYEQVIFYERYLNLPQAEGVSLIEK
jgi:hypothetical protein